MPLTTRPASTSRQAMMRLARYGVPCKPGVKAEFGLLGWSGSDGTEILQDFQTCFGGFLRMELHSENVVALHRSRKCAAIICAGRRLCNHGCTIGVRVINKCAAVHALKQTRSRTNF